MMTLTLTIQDIAVLPDGGPVSITLNDRRGIDIGRDQYLDWTLPDPDRVISSKHAEVRYRDGAYWLQDVSRNGTYVNQSPHRLQEAYCLKDGDHIKIGRYAILAHVDSQPIAIPPTRNTLSVLALLMNRLRDEPTLRARFAADPDVVLLECGVDPAHFNLGKNLSYVDVDKFINKWRVTELSWHFQEIESQQPIWRALPAPAYGPPPGPSLRPQVLRQWPDSDKPDFDDWMVDEPKSDEWLTAPTPLEDPTPSFPPIFPTSQEEKSDTSDPTDEWWASLPNPSPDRRRR